MRLRSKILSGLLGLIAAGTIWASYELSHEHPCAAAPSPPAGAATMDAWVRHCYGGPEVLTFESLIRPVADDDQVLVRVHAASVNPLDWHYLRGTPYIMRMELGTGAPRESAMGVDFAGVVEAVGSKVKRLRVGDEVFGARDGAFGQFVAVREDHALAIKPPQITFEQAAAVPIAGITALQALRDLGRLEAGQKVLINGASGGVGTFAVQIAKALGAQVTGVCSTRNVELVRSLGADHVIDYTRENFTQGERQYDLIIDNVGNHSLSDYRRVLQPTGIFVIVGGSSENQWLGPLIGPIKASVYDPFVSQEYEFIMAQLKAEDLATLRELLESGKVKPVVDRTYPFSELPEAIRYLETGRARGKVVVKIG